MARRPPPSRTPAGPSTPKRTLRPTSKASGSTRRHANGDENRLIGGDNLEAMERLVVERAASFRLVYVDPPYNTGRTFKEYRDARAPDEWRAMMRPRLELMRELLRPDGTLVAEIDDTELGSLLVLLDELFGRESRAAVVTVVRSAATGHKAKNRGPVNVTDYLLVYARDKRAYRPNVVVRPRDRDPAYRTVLVDETAPPEAMRFAPLGRFVAGELGFASPLRARQAIGAHAFAARVDAFCLAHPERVVRFAQPRYEAISREAQRLVDLSRREPDRVFVLERPRHPPLVLRGGNRLLRLSEKVREVEGVRCFVEPLTNVWDDVPFQGIASEGGVTFSRNKKPEQLLARILELFTNRGDWVLDPFLGSGTTAAVAHKLGRRYVGIESSRALLHDLCVPRLTRVAAGLDATGISRKTSYPAQSLRGGFRVE